MEGERGMFSSYSEKELTSVVFVCTYFTIHITIWLFQQREKRREEIPPTLDNAFTLTEFQDKNKFLFG